MEKLKIRYLNLLWIHWKKIIFALGVFCFFSGSSLMEVKMLNGSLEEFILTSITDKYYWIFCALPIYIWFLFSSFSQTSSMVIKRYRFCYTYFLAELIPIAIFTLLFVLGPVACSSIIGLSAGLPIFSQHSDELLQSFYGEVLGIYIEHYDSYILSIFLTELYLFIGLCFFAVVLKYLCYPFSQKAVLFFMILCYMSALYAIQRGIDVYAPYLFFSNYLFLTQALVGNCEWVCLIIMFLGSILCVLGIRKRWGCKNIK